jgi:uncharacterized HAD superfamily protein
MRNKEMGSYRASRALNVPQTTLELYIKDREKSLNEEIKTKLGTKQVLPCEAENELDEHRLLVERKFANAILFLYQMHNCGPFKE